MRDLTPPVGRAGGVRSGRAAGRFVIHLLAARQVYQDPATGRRIKPGAKVGGAYQEASLPCRSLEAVASGGVRLMWMLNVAL